MSCLAHSPKLLFFPPCLLLIYEAHWMYTAAFLLLFLSIHRVSTSKSNMFNSHFLACRNFAKIKHAVFRCLLFLATILCSCFFLICLRLITILTFSSFIIVQFLLFITILSPPLWRKALALLAIRLAGLMTLCPENHSFNHCNQLIIPVSEAFNKPVGRWF